MFVPHKGYGFVDCEGESVFFSADSFERLVPGGPPPVLGERVIVSGVTPSEKGQPRASRVCRAKKPLMLGGTVRKFDVRGGWGFVTGEDQQEYFLHRSDIQSNSIPVQGVRVVFYPCIRKGKSRACHVTVHG
jgi:cold shock CspA family protein